MRKKWRQIHYWESEYEEDLKNRFEAALDVFYAKYKEAEKESEAAKRELIEKAKALVKSEDLKQATKEQQDLLEEWKKIASAGKERDDALWKNSRLLVKHSMTANKKRGKQCMKTLKEPKKSKRIDSKGKSIGRIFRMEKDFRKIPHSDDRMA